MQTEHARAVRSAYYYETRAEEVRTIADHTSNEWCRKVLDSIADDYIRLAGDCLNRERKAARKPRCPSLEPGADNPIPE